MQYCIKLTLTSGKTETIICSGYSSRIEAEVDLLVKFGAGTKINK